MNISTKGRYGLRAMLDLAMNQEKNPIPLSSIADRQGLSEGYLEQLMIPLKRAGLVRSIRGAQGGYLLVKEPTEITVGDVIRALEGPVAPVSCVNKHFPKDCNKAESCMTKVVWAKLRDSVEEALDSFSLTDLINKDAKKNNDKTR